MRYLPVKEFKCLLQPAPTQFPEASNALAVGKGPSKQAKYQHEHGFGLPTTSTDFKRTT